METRLQKWRNSDGIRIPSSILKALNFKTNDAINLEQIKDKIIVSKLVKYKISLAEKFKEYHGEHIRSIDYESRDLIFAEKCNNDDFDNKTMLLKSMYRRVKITKLYSFIIFQHEHNFIKILTTYYSVVNIKK